MSLFMSTEDAAEWSESIGQVVSGATRQIILAVKTGVPDELGMTAEAWRANYFPLYRVPREELPEAARELTDAGLTQREAGAVLGVSHRTVGNNLPRPEPVAGPGKNYPDPDPEPESPQVEDSPLWEEPIPGKNYPDPDPEPESPISTRDLLAQSDENEWYTPRRFTAAAALVLGKIDLDPASSAIANEIVQAIQYYTIHDNGLEQPWKGNVWLNPPYGGENRLFVERLIREYEAGNVTAAITLVNCHPAETQWFQKLFDYTVCFVRGRIDFTGPARDRASTSTHGSAIAYLGPEWEKFATEFGRFGAVVRRV